MHLVDECFEQDMAPISERADGVISTDSDGMLKEEVYGGNDEQNSKIPKPLVRTGCIPCL